MSVKNNYPKDNSNGWYGACEIDFKELQKENEELKEEIKNLKRETISREEHQKVCDFLNNQAEEYIKKYVDLIEK